MISGSPAEISASDRRASRVKKMVQLLLGLAVSAGCLWWAVRGMLQDPKAWPQIVAAFKGANYWLLIPSWIGLFLFYWLKAWRWRLLLAPIGSFRPMRDCFPPIMIGFAFNNLLPAHLGEFVRVLVFGRRHGVHKAAVLSTVVLERVFDILAIVAFLTCGLFFVEGLEPALRNKAIWFGSAALVLTIGAAVFVTWTGTVVRLVESILGALPLIPASLKTRVTELLEAAAHGMNALHSPALLGGIVATSLLQWAVNGWLMYLALASFGVTVSIWVVCILLGVVAFGVTVPSSPGYFGVMQLFFMSVLKLFTPNQESVFAASVFYQLAQYIPVTLIGLYFFNRTGLSVSQIQNRRDEPTAEVVKKTSPATAG
jgi:uncharacterized protein (TIRG00374 family)